VDVRDQEYKVLDLNQGDAPISPFQNLATQGFDKAGQSPEAGRIPERQKLPIRSFRSSSLENILARKELRSEELVRRGSKGDYLSRKASTGEELARKGSKGDPWSIPPPRPPPPTPPTPRSNCLAELPFNAPSTVAYQTHSSQNQIHVVDSLLLIDVDDILAGCLLCLHVAYCVCIPTMLCCRSLPNLHIQGYICYRRRRISFMTSHAGKESPPVIRGDVAWFTYTKPLVVRRP
jgi:hypothetical protein